MIYLDHCASTPVCNLSKNALNEFLGNHFGNPAVAHHEAGQKAKAIVDSYRKKLADQFKTTPENIIFTSGATESNNMVIKGFALKHKNKCRIVYGSSEHKCVVEAVKQMKRVFDLDVCELKVDKKANIDLKELEGFLKNNPDNKKTLVCLMHTNNEVPRKHPVDQIAKLCKKYHAYYHCDAVQGFVRERVNFEDLPASFFSLSAHKLYGPKGMGVLAINSDHSKVPLIEPLLDGGGQEYGMRSGTIAAPTIVGGSEAILSHLEKLDKHNKHMTNLSETFISYASKKIPGLKYTLEPNMDAVGLINFYIDGVNATVLINKLPHICLNRGSACSAGSEKGSHVPYEMGFPPEVATNVYRASFGWGVTKEEVISAIDQIAAAI